MVSHRVYASWISSFLRMILDSSIFQSHPQSTVLSWLHHHDKNISNYFSALCTILLHFFLLYVVAITNEIDQMQLQYHDSWNKPVENMYMCVYARILVHTSKKYNCSTNGTRKWRREDKRRQEKERERERGISLDWQIMLVVSRL